ncbi:HNH endonuclease [Arthrobacter sp. ok909]|uniref:HNH endonuclease signature motif containing protein n=1 Tax=Arthrobacter sp. ok909 TaxID=1761746 RepID=UPI000881CA80|nr:HNH endonuclease signature motif containing protein [Arthrobacter sp. ok909]SDP09819.1 HNH endonuclease [Arthrobacter sp. ok909]
MKAVGAFIPERAPWAGPGASPRRSCVAAAAGALEASHIGGAGHAGNGALGGAANAAVDGGVGGAVDSALALLRSAAPAAGAEAARFSLVEAADFAGRVEEFSRTVEYFQLIAAAAVDRTRKQTAWTRPAPAGWEAEAEAQAGWLTGWTQNTSTDTDTGSEAGAGAGSDGGGGAGSEVRAEAGGWTAFGRSGGPADVCAAADDGYKNTTEFLRARLRISAPEARRRLTQAADLLPRQGLTGAPVPAVHEELGAAVAAGEIASRTATIITTAMDRVRHLCPPGTAAAMEHALTLTAIENDPDFLTRIARRWTDALDQDGAEPSEEALRRLQGAFIRKPRHGLHHLEIFATTDQFEHLITAMNTATNPRTSAGTVPGPDPTADPGTGDGAATDTAADGAGRAGGVCGETDGSVTDADAVGGIHDGSGLAAGTAAWSNAAVSGAAGAADAADVLDRRSRPQRLLDGLVGACDAALAAGALPAAGGLRPQVMATIDYRDLLGRLEQTGTPNDPAGTPGPGTGSLMFTGPVTASTIRKLACDADIIPVLLGTEGRILDIGRTSRIFPPHLRKALTARDQGCAFPQCTIPAPWCEAHHITYWSRGGSTSTDNGTLLCSHHHHLIHKEQWTIQMRSGIPWFIPPPHVDPRQTPRRNKHFRPDMPRQ